MMPNVMACHLILDLREEGRGGGNISWVTTGHTDRAFAIPDLVAVLFNRNGKQAEEISGVLPTMHFEKRSDLEVETGPSMPRFARPSERLTDLELGCDISDSGSIVQDWGRRVTVQSSYSSPLDDLVDGQIDERPRNDCPSVGMVDGVSKVSLNSGLWR